jgi:hypothetical protein
MKKSLLAAAVLSAVSFGAYADGVELYGILDVAAGSVNQQTGVSGISAPSINIVDPIKTSVATKSTTAMVNGGISGSRWGIKGSETIDDDLSAIFTLESCINITTGSLCNNAAAMVAGANQANNQISASSLDGQLFGRLAFVGLKSKELGQVTIGRNKQLAADVYDSYAPNQNAQQFTPTGYSGTLGGALGETEYARLDNSIKYTNKSGDINYGLIYGFGNIAGSTSAGQGFQANLGYEKNGFGIQAVYGQQNDVLQGAQNDLTVASYPTATIYSAAAPLKFTFFNSSGFAVLAKYKFNDALTGKVGYQRFTLNTPSNPTLDLAITTYNSYTITNGQQLEVTAAQSQSISHIGFDYKVSDNLNVGMGYFVRQYETCTSNASNLTTGFLGSASTSKCGLTANFSSLLADYNLSKRTDVYVGAMTSSYGGTSTVYQNNSFVAVGMRTKF